jgi:hypothetical protein
MPAAALGDEKCAAQIGVHDGIELSLGLFEERPGHDDARAVQQHIRRPSQLAHDSVERGIERLRAQHVERDSHRAMSFGAQLRRVVVDPLLASRRQGHRSPGARKHPCQMPADPARRPGNEGHAITQAERVHFAR